MQMSVGDAAENEAGIIGKTFLLDSIDLVIPVDKIKITSDGPNAAKLEDGVYGKTIKAWIAVEIDNSINRVKEEILGGDLDTVNKVNV
jgi:hypothetical protein